MNSTREPNPMRHVLNDNVVDNDHRRINTLIREVIKREVHALHTPATHEPLHTSVLATLR